MLLKEWWSALRCPKCSSQLVRTARRMACTEEGCRAEYPIMDGIPVLIDEDASIASIEEILEAREPVPLTPAKKMFRRLYELLPSIDLNLSARKNYALFAERLLQDCQRPRILVVGGRIAGAGMEDILSHESLEFVESDIEFGPRTALVCDAHSLPFGAHVFDGVIIQGVLPFVLNPARCVNEIHRVLKQNGIVYAESAFVQQRAGQYDFTRFTFMGHRRLFRRFEDLCSGIACGPGMVLAWSYEHFLLSFVSGRSRTAMVRAFVRITAFWLKYFDYYLVNKAATYGAASSFYFMGRKSESTLSGKQIIESCCDRYAPF